MNFIKRKLYQSALRSEEPKMMLGLAAAYGILEVFGWQGIWIAFKCWKEQKKNAGRTKDEGV